MISFFTPSFLFGHNSKEMVKHFNSTSKSIAKHELIVKIDVYKGSNVYVLKMMDYLTENSCEDRDRVQRYDGPLRAATQAGASGRPCRQP